MTGKEVVSAAFGLNVSPTGTFLSGTPEEVIREGKTCIEAWGQGGGYVLGPGCDLPKNVPFENIRALMSLKEKLL